MKFFTKNGIKQKIIIAIIMVILVNFAIPQTVQANPVADIFSNVGQTLLKEIVILFCSLGDVGMGFLSNTMLGAKISSTMLGQDNDNINNTNSWLYATDAEINKAKDEGRYVEINNIQGGLGIADYEIPNILYSPESIFSNNIAALDVNFLKPNTYSAINDEDSAIEKAESGAGKLQQTISNWYKSFRNIAVVGLLSVLIYLGIRILLSSTAADKAKYKQSLTDWFVALCLVFFIHFIMSGILMVTDKVTDLFAVNEDNAIIVKASKAGDQTHTFKTNLIGLARMRTQTEDWYEVTAYGFMYLILVVYTFVFTFMYLKRLLYMAFFTMIAPLVALTYPLDKLGDSKAQAFNIWFKEYLMNAIIQPVHLILYTAFITSAMSLATENMLYAIVAILFLMPAEKFIKKMFGLDKGETTGSFADSALKMAGISQLANLAKKGNKAVNGGKGKNASMGDGTDSGEGNYMPVKTTRPGLSSTFAGVGQTGGTTGSGTQTSPGGATIPNGAPGNGTQTPSGGGTEPNGRITPELDAIQEDSVRQMMEDTGMTREEAMEELGYVAPGIRQATNNTDNNNAGTNNVTNTNAGNNNQPNTQVNNRTRRTRGDKALAATKLLAPKVGRGAYKLAKTGLKAAGAIGGGMTGFAMGAVLGGRRL